MVGGKVIGVVRGGGDTMLHVRGTGSEQGDTCCLRVVERRKDTGEPVAIGVEDQVWWQGRDAMWTPAGTRCSDDPGGCGKRWDIHLPRVGWTFASSHVSSAEESIA